MVLAFIIPVAFVVGILIFIIIIRCYRRLRKSVKQRLSFQPRRFSNESFDIKENRLYDETSPSKPITSNPIYDKQETTSDCSENKVYDKNSVRLSIKENTLYDNISEGDEDDTMTDNVAYEKSPLIVDIKDNEVYYSTPSEVRKMDNS